MKRLAPKLLVLGLSAVLALGACELFLRFTTPLHAEGWFELTDDPDLYYLPTPSLAYRLDGSPYTHNAQGLRDEQERAPGAEGVQRVAFVGDSVCYGVGVGDDETASAVAGRLLGEASEGALETLNFGVPGYNSHQVASAAERRVTAFDGVHTIVYLYHENDVVNATFSNADVHLPAALFHRYEKPGPTWRRWLKRSHLAMFVYKLGRGGGGTALAGAGAAPEAPTAYRAPYPLYRGLLLERGRYHDQVGANLARLAGVGGESVRKLVVYVPSVFSLHLDTEDEMAATLATLASEHGLEFLDGRKALLPADEPLYYDAGHPNALGHARLARAIVERLQE